MYYRTTEFLIENNMNVHTIQMNVCNHVTIYV